MCKCWEWKPFCLKTFATVATFDSKKRQMDARMTKPRDLASRWNFSSIIIGVFVSFSELTRVCSYPVGIQSGRLKNSQITAKSMWNKYHAPYLGRLKRVRHGRYMGGWSARHNNHQQWLQFDLRRVLKLAMISTQGRKLVKQWVTRYTISYSVDCVHFVPYKQRDRLKVRQSLSV